MTTQLLSAGAGTHAKMLFELGTHVGMRSKAMIQCQSCQWNHRITQLEEQGAQSLLGAVLVDAHAIGVLEHPAQVVWRGGVSFGQQL